jgi:ferredoxin-type protein NapG
MRCGACVQVCPTWALAQRDLSPDFRSIGVPYIQAKRGGCIAWENGCRICADVCPSKALNPAIELIGLRVAVARFPPSSCTNCLACLRRCPIDRAIFFPNPDGGAPWYRWQINSIPPNLKIAQSPIKPVIDETLCVGCGLCVAQCLHRIMYLAPRSKEG